MMARCDVRGKDFWCCGNSKFDFRMNCAIAVLTNVYLMKSVGEHYER